MEVPEYPDPELEAPDPVVAEPEPELAWLVPGLEVPEYFVVGVCDLVLAAECELGGVTPAQNLAIVSSAALAAAARLEKATDWFLWLLAPAETFEDELYATQRP